jgi:putative ABC transport system permease protein
MNVNNFKIAWRNTTKHKAVSLINIIGLSAGMAVAIVIGLWVHDELTFNHYHDNHREIAEVMQNVTVNGLITTSEQTPIPLGNELKRLYGSDFKAVVMSTGIRSMVLSLGDKNLTKQGGYFGAEAPEMLSLRMISGSREGLSEPASILLSSSCATAFFGNADAVGQTIRIDTTNLKVKGVYQDIPVSSDFTGMDFMAPWDLYISHSERDRLADWDYNSFRTYVQLADKAKMAAVSAKIKDIKMNRVNKTVQKYQPTMFLHPMDAWHLHSDFKNGVSTGGRNQLVWLFAIIGLFVLVMACINFMNLATARSEKRAREVGIRKVIGSSRDQLIRQFLSESLVVTGIAFVIAVILTIVFLPFFNEVSGKSMNIPWRDPVFWLISVAFCVATGLIAGSYPALYLSSFRPITVLKGTFKAGTIATLPRKALVVLQFTISIALIIGVCVVFRQVQFAESRSMGYNPQGLVVVPVRSSNIHDHFDAIDNELQRSGAITSMAESHSPLNQVFLNIGGFDWSGKNPQLEASFNTLKVSHDYGKTVEWQIKAGRDFSRDLKTDSTAMILNEAAVKFMNVEHPLGTIVTQKDFLKGVPYTVIGVVDDVLMESPYKAVAPTVYIINNRKGNFAVIRLNNTMNTGSALEKVEAVFKQYNPTAPFDYQFVTEQHEHKFGDEKRIEKLAGFFSILAIVISCLGIFGLSSFMAEQRIKEIGIRKVLGATRLGIWVLLSRDFVMLVAISFVIATPVAYYFTHRWLQGFEYRSSPGWMLFAGAGLATLLVALLTVSLQSFRAASVNPVTSLRTE